MQIRRLLLFSLVVLTIGAVVVFSLWHLDTDAAHRRPRLVVLYATCTLNVDFLSPYNRHVPYTPALERFADEGVVFRRHHTESGISGVAFAALLSGNQADRHGIFSHPMRLSDDVRLIAEAYEENGYDTYFWADHPMSSPKLNYDQGVVAEHVYWDPPPQRAAGREERFLKAGDPRFQSILQRLQDDETYRAFVQTTFTVTHAFYSAEHVDEFCRFYPQECAGLTEEEFRRYSRLLGKNYLKLVLSFDQTRRELGLDDEDVRKLRLAGRIRYASNVFYLDQLFGELVEEIRRSGLLDEAMIVFTADHGEVLYRDDAPLKWTHGFTLAPEVIRIPWLLHAPGVEPRRYEGVTRSVDVFPTLAGLSGLSLEDGATMGVDLSPALRGNESPPHLLALAHTALPPKPWLARLRELPALRAALPSRDPSQMWVLARDGDIVYKLSRRQGADAIEPSVYDWAHDLGEERDLYDPSDESQQEMLRRLAEYKARLVESYSRWKARAEGRVPSARQKEILRSLGYID